MPAKKSKGFKGKMDKNRKKPVVYVWPETLKKIKEYAKTQKRTITGQVDIILTDFLSKLL